MSEAQTNYRVEIEHLLLKLIGLRDTDVAAVLRYYKLDSDDLARQLTTAIDEFDRGNSRSSSISPQTSSLLREAWIQSTLVLHSRSIRSGGILLALYEDDALRGTIFGSCPTLAKVSRESLRETISDLIRKSNEEMQ